MRTIPNMLTISRLLIIPVLVWLLISPTPQDRMLAAFVFLIAALTDGVDGFIARKFKAVSEVGKLLDPLADKLLVMSALVMLCSLRSPLDGLAWVPAWMVVLILAREIWITGLRGIAATQGMLVAASSAGKVKSVLQMAAIVLLILPDTHIAVLTFIMSAQILGLYLLLISILVSYFSAIEYTLMVFEHISSGMNDGPQNNEE